MLFRSLFSKGGTIADHGMCYILFGMDLGFKDIFGRVSQIYSICGNWTCFWVYTCSIFVRYNVIYTYSWFVLHDVYLTCIDVICRHVFHFCLDVIYGSFKYKYLYFQCAIKLSFPRKIKPTLLNISNHLGFLYFLKITTSSATIVILYSTGVMSLID